MTVVEREGERKPIMFPNFHSSEQVAEYGRERIFYPSI